VRPTLLLNRPPARSFGVIDSKVLNYELALMPIIKACGMPNGRGRASGDQGIRNE
jgi:hypothetical protein